MNNNKRKLTFDNSSETSFNPLEDLNEEEMKAVASMGKKLMNSQFNPDDLSDMEKSVFNKITDRLVSEQEKFEDKLIAEYMDEKYMNENDADDDDDDNEGCDDTSAELERIGDELEEISKGLNEMCNNDNGTSWGITTICEYMEKIHDLYEEKLMREKNDFIVLNAQHPDGSIVPVKVRISAITLIVDIPNEEGVSEVLTPSFGSNNAVRVYHTSDEVLELIRKAKRTDYEVYKETLAENGVTEDEIYCYVAHQSPDLAAPHMTMEQTISYIDKVKKAKDEGFDFSIKHLNERRKAREEEIMKKAQADMNRSND